MKILAVAFAYNEMPYIADFVDLYRKEGCDIFVLDNHSTDGTTEYLRDQKVMSDICYTGGAFDLKKLQAGLVRMINIIRPDWVVYTGIDIIYYFKKTIRKIILDADLKGYNMIGIKYFNMYNTGEQFALPLKDHFFYAREFGNLYMISKFQHPFGFEADSIQIKEKKIKVYPGVFINYGNCKPYKEREDTFRRRQKAWNRGLDPNYGVHYIEGHNKGWIWKKSELIDIRTTEYYQYILNHDSTNNANRSKEGSV